MLHQALHRAIAGILVCLAVRAGADDGAWRAGTARAAITPEANLWLSGYASRERPASGKLHELWAKALVIEDPDGGRAVLVTLDLIGIPRDLSLRVARDIAERHGLERAQIALSASHTHTGPIVGRNLEAMYRLDDAAAAAIGDYARSLERTIPRIAGEAIERLAPATIAWTRGFESFAVNRRNNPEREVSELRAAGTLAGPVDHDVPILRVADAKGSVIAAVFGYACHATTLSSYEYSGDWPGFAQNAFERRHPGTTAMFWAGCGADQNPLPRRTVELSTEYGERLARAVDLALAAPLRTLAASERIDTRYAEIALAFASIPTEDDVARDMASDNVYTAGRARLLAAELERDGHIAPDYPYPVQLWRLGDELRWVFLGGEVVVDYSLRIRRELGADRTWVTGYANDVMAYIPSERVLAEGGYEGGGAMVYYGLPSSWAPGLEEKIIAKVREFADGDRR